MSTLTVTVGREIQFTSSPDLPAAFRKAIAADNTFANPLHGKRKGVPATVEAFYHNPFTKEVALPRSYWPQFQARADEYDVDLVVIDQTEFYPAVVHSQVAIALQDLGFGLDVLKDLVAGAIPTDWESISINITITQHKRMPEEPPPPPPAPEEPLAPAPWEAGFRG